MTITLPRNVLTVWGAALLVAGCASSPDNIQASYVSPITYETYSCDQLAVEGQRVSTRGRRRSQASRAKTAPMIR